ncbi:MAG: hypothetical protein IIA49_06450 [Bacteroidetes bacterium]|nr:hypothetical protein [Bacteroidota bacterium]
MTKDEISKDVLISKLKYIDAAVMEITDVLDRLNSIREPVLSDYTGDIKMIKIDDEAKV